MADELTEWCAPAIGCERHKGEWLRRRCAHLGNRFVVWSQMERDDGKNGRWWWAFVDYVEDLPGGGVIVEGHHARSVDAAEELWDLLVARMRAGEPPETEAGI